MIKRILFALAFTVAGLVLVLYFFFGRGGSASEIKWGASFDPYYAESLGLDWQKTYLALLDEV